MTNQVQDNKNAKFVINNLAYSCEEIVSEFKKDFKRQRSESFIYSWMGVRGLNFSKNGHMIIFNYLITQ